MTPIMTPADSVQLGVSGFGRIGRLVVRSAFETEGACIAAINDPHCDVEYAAYLFKHDSTHGLLAGPVSYERGETPSGGSPCDAVSFLIVNGHKIRYFSQSEPKDVGWGAAGVAIVLDCSGKFKTEEKASGHLASGARKVIISAPSPDAPMYVMGVNHAEYTKDVCVMSTASCTTNCLAPLAKIIQDAWGIEEGLMSTVHAVTATQKCVDEPRSASMHPLHANGALGEDASRTSSPHRRAPWRPPPK